MRPALPIHMLIARARNSRITQAVVANIMLLLITAGGINPAIASGYEFSFARMVYHSTTEGPRWQVDWPDAETYFTRGVQRLTRISTDPEGILMELDSDELFDYPWLYVVEVGYMRISPRQSTNLREYLLRGGFLMVDDFHGPYEWANFEAVMEAVFPERAIVELDDDSEAFHVLYDLRERQQIPGIYSVMNNRTWEKGGRHPHWRGIFDDQQRLMVAINFNQDIGDAWEHADEPFYPEPYTALAYRMGINYLLYAMTH